MTSSIPYMIALHFFIAGDSLEGKTAEERGQKLLRQASAKEADVKLHIPYKYQYDYKQIMWIFIRNNVEL